MTCKNCGAEIIENQAIDGVIECEYCFSRYTMPKKSASPAALEFMRIGEHDLDTGRFEDAYIAYEKAAKIDESEPEAQFGMALSLFKVQYIKDEINSRLQAICHELTEKKFQDDSRYLSALRLATEAQKKEYRKKAEEIDYIRGKFVELKKSGLDFDCFLCVKVTDERGEKTEDSKDADYIYDLLRDRGFKPFYSERNIRNRTGADYEAMILYALYSSETMLVISRNEEYLRTPWVKNEYTRFLRLLHDSEKESDAITIVYYGNPIERLAGKRGKIQGIDFSKREADRLICDFVEVHTAEAKARRQKEEEEKKNREDKLLRELEKQRKVQKELEARISAMQAEKPSPPVQREPKIDLPKKPEPRARVSVSTTLKDYSSYEFEINSWGRLRKYKGSNKNVSIPVGVTEIGERAFECSSITSVIIPDSVTSIGECAFLCCNSLTSVTIPDGVTKIGDAAFARCPSLTSVSIPKSVTSIEGNPFSGCSSLASITVDKNNRRYAMKDGALYNKDKTLLIRVSARLTTFNIPNTVTTIGSGAFNECTLLRDVTIPNGVTTIDRGVFSGCSSLTSITIPNSVTTIGAVAFSHCSLLASVTLPSNLAAIDDFTFYKCTRLTDVIIPDTVTAIGKCAFDECSSLKNISIPNGVLSIGESAFAYCKSLTDVSIGSTVTSIGILAFMQCDSVERVTMPKRFKRNRYSVGRKKTKFTFTK